VLHRKYGRLVLLRKPFRFFVFASQTLQVFCLALRKKAQYVVVALQFVVIFCNPRKKPQDDNELGGLSSFSLTQEKTHKMTMSRKACHHFLQPKRKTTRQR
jgi:hypothetical protein